MKIAQVVALFGAGLASASPASFCPADAGGVCYSIAIPTSSANAGSGNIYFQIKAPTSFQWVALGTGSAMAGSNIFLTYQDGRGNLTLSPRLGTQYTMPTLDTSSTAARLTLLAGSGVSADGSTMTANVACSNCQSWSGGQMSLKSTSAKWIGAWKSGPSLATTDRAASITQHDGHSQFQVDLTKATISSDSNPFTTTNAGSSTGSGSNSGSNSGITDTSSSDKGSVLVAHGIVMLLVMAALYPLGSTLMPLAGKWWVHGAWQTVTFCLMWAGFGLGVETARSRNMLFKQTHTTFGTVIVSLLGIQPFLGLLHHRHFLKTKSRGVVSYVHIWWGRILMVLGVINGGLGLQLASERNGLVIAYSVIAAVMFLVYACAKVCAVFLGKDRAKWVGNKETNATAPRRPYQESRGHTYA